MAHSLSAKKRIRQNEKRRMVNRGRRSALKSCLRKSTEVLTAGKDVPAAEKATRDASRAIDQAAAKGTLHRNAAARRKSRLAKKLNALKKQPVA